MPSDSPPLSKLERLKQGALDATTLSEARYFVEAIIAEAPTDGTLVWLKTYAQYAPTAVTRAAAVEGLTAHWPQVFNVFEIAYKCAIGDPFQRNGHNGDAVNPRAIALEAICKCYPEERRTGFLLCDRAENDADPQVRDLAKQLIDGRLDSQVESPA
ncbi:MAG: hypothetical protein Fur0042_24120 [Cyanophyceae cyanobacterium]